jgi:hypothetical protein
MRGIQSAWKELHYTVFLRPPRGQDRNVPTRRRAKGLSQNQCFLTLALRITPIEWLAACATHADKLPRGERSFTRGNFAPRISDFGDHDQASALPYITCATEKEEDLTTERLNTSALKQ